MKCCYRLDALAFFWSHFAVLLRWTFLSGAQKTMKQTTWNFILSFSRSSEASLTRSNRSEKCLFPIVRRFSSVSLFAHFIIALNMLSLRWWTRRARKSKTRTYCTVCPFTRFSFSSIALARCHFTLIILYGDVLFSSFFFFVIFLYLHRCRRRLLWLKSQMITFLNRRPLSFDVVYIATHTRDMISVHANKDTKTTTKCSRIRRNIAFTFLVASVHVTLVSGSVSVVYWANIKKTMSWNGVA